MLSSLNIWGTIIWLIRIERALTWNQEEQFVEGDFPYYPFNSRISFLRDGLTDARAIASEFSGSKLIEGQAKSGKNPFEKRFISDTRNQDAFYEFRNDSDTMIDATKPETNRTNKKPKRFECKKLSKLWKKTFKETKKNKNETVEDAETNDAASGIKKRESSLFDTPRARFLPNESNGNDNLSFSEAMETLNELTQPTVGTVERSLWKKSQGGEEAKLENEASHVQSDEEAAVAGYEPKKSTNKWLAGELEKYVRAKDFKWLDFIKNSEERKTPCVITDTGKRLTVKHALRDARSITARRKPRTGAQLVDEIDTLLADLSRFRASIKGPQKRAAVQPSPTSADSLTRVGRSASSVDSSSDRRSYESLKNDLQDLKKNIFLYESNGVDDENRQALKDMKLHIKVYVEKDEGGNFEEQ